MNSKVKAIYGGALLALTISITKPVMADEWNKRTEFTFSGPVQIPGRVLAAGKYVFELAESDSDRSIVQVFSEDSNGKQSLIATILAIPDYVLDTPDKATIRFDERPGAPEAIHSWFYPGENTGWQFVYPASQTAEVSADTTPALAPPPAPVATEAPAPLTTEPAATTADKPALSPPPVPQVQEDNSGAEVTATEEEVTLVTDDEPAPQLAPDTDPQDSDTPSLPQTGGHSDLELMTGFAMLVGGIAAVFASHRRSLA